MKVFCFTCGNTQAQVVTTKGEYNLVECTQCGCRWRRSLDPLYERTALVEVDVGEKIAATAAPPRARAAEGGDKVPLGCNDNSGMKMRLIDANEILKMKEHFFNAFIGEMAVVFAEDIENAPTISPDSLRPKGQWIGEADGYADGELVYDVWYCSECNHCIDDGTDDSEALPNYCPNCGADMRKVEDTPPSALQDAASPQGAPLKTQMLFERRNEIY